LKPANVLVDEVDGRRQVKLCDFGSGGVLDQARLEALGITRMGFTRTMLDASGTTSGTPLYLAPEVIAGQPFTVQADIYALGVILYQMVSGDFRRGLAPGWEAEVTDELLRDDIASAAAGNPAKRLPDPSLVAGRLRSLDKRREALRLEREAAALAQLRQKKLQRARVRDRVVMLVAVLMLAAAFPITKYYRDAMQARRDAEAVSDFLADEVLSMADPNVGKTDDLSFKAVIQRAAERVEQKLAEQPVAAARVHLALANSLSWFDLSTESLEHTRRAAALYEQAFGRDSEKTQEALIALVWALREIGLHDEGAALSNEVVQYATSHWAPEDPRTLNVKFQMANVARSMGHISEPLAFMREVIDAADRALPEDERNPWWYYWYGTVLSNAGEFGEAEKIFQRAREMHARRSGPEHYATAWADRAHGQMLANQGRFAEAEAEVRMAHAKMEKWRGAGNEQAIVFHASIGDVLLDSGHPAEALAIFEADHARCCTKSYDVDKLSPVEMSLARLYVQSGRARDAIPLLERLAAGLEATPAWANRRLGNAQIALAEAWLAAGDAAKAQAQLDGVSPTFTRDLPPRHLAWASLHRVQGLIWLRQRQIDKARAALTEARDIYAFRLAPTHRFAIRAAEELKRAEAASPARPAALR
jgi:eukaryotic-like serine/threonine-protein kinase